LETPRSSCKPRLPCTFLFRGEEDLLVLHLDPCVPFNP
jgi:hypothetical protein